uniref:Uncharacterized protein n=1 Tax=Arundo donax TaxID=35708 RepID=A0A0A8ZQN8_ARUDO
MMCLAIKYTFSFPPSCYAMSCTPVEFNRD